MASLYLPTFFNPRNTTISPSVDNDFSCQINGSICVAYELYIKKNSDNTLVYDSNKITLPTPLYNKEILKHTVIANILTAGIDYKWIIRVYYDSTNYIDSGENFFHCYSTPTVELNPPSIINTQSYSFVTNYTQAQGIAVNRFKYLLYDNYNNLIKDSGYIYGSNITYLFDGFINANIYKIRSITENEMGVVVDSGVKIFTVEYAPPTVGLVPSVELLYDLGASRVDWGEAKQILGVATGSYSYIDGGGINLDKGSKIDFEFFIPSINTIVEKFNSLDSDFYGTLYSSENNNYTVGYDGSRFYFNNGGISVYGIPRSIPVGTFFIFIYPTYVVIESDTTEIIQV